MDKEYSWSVNLKKTVNEREHSCNGDADANAEFWDYQIVPQVKQTQA